MIKKPIQCPKIRSETSILIQLYLSPILIAMSQYLPNNSMKTNPFALKPEQLDSPWQNLSIDNRYQMWYSLRTITMKVSSYHTLYICMAETQNHYHEVIIVKWCGTVHRSCKSLFASLSCLPQGRSQLSQWSFHLLSIRQPISLFHSNTRCCWSFKYSDRGGV